MHIDPVIRILRGVSLAIVIGMLVALQAVWSDLVTAAVGTGLSHSTLPSTLRTFIPKDALQDGALPLNAIIVLCTFYFTGIISSILRKCNLMSAVILIETQVAMLAFAFVWSTSIQRLGAHYALGSVSELSNRLYIAYGVCFLGFIACEVLAKMLRKLRREQVNTRQSDNA